MTDAAVKTFAHVAIASVELYHGLRYQGVGTRNTRPDEMADEAVALARNMFKNIYGAV